MVSVCLPSDALSQHLPSHLGFSYLGHGVSLHGCSSKVQPLCLTLDEVTPPDLECGVAPLSPPVPAHPLLLGCVVVPLGCFSNVQFFANLWTVAHRAFLSIGFFRQEYWSGLPFPPPGCLPHPRIEPTSPGSPVLHANSLLSSHWGSPT